MKTVILGLVAMILLLIGALACFLTFGLGRAARERDKPVLPDSVGQDSPMQDHCILHKLNLLRGETCNKVCPVDTCQGKNRMMRMICSWLDKKS